MNFEIERIGRNLHVGNQRICQPRANLSCTIHSRRQAELLRVVITRDRNPSTVNQPPETCDDKARPVCKRNDPVELTMYERSKTKPSQPVQISQLRSCVRHTKLDNRHSASLPIGRTSLPLRCVRTSPSVARACSAAFSSRATTSGWSAETSFVSPMSSLRS